jgi:hypothetical protein
LGNIQWQKSLGGSGDDVATSEAIYYNGATIVGYSNSTNGDINDNHGGYDYWVLELDTLGNVSAKQSFGGSGDDRATSIDRSGTFIGGYSNSTDGEIVGNHGEYNYWIIWTEPAQYNSVAASFIPCFGGSGDDRANCVTLYKGPCYSGYSCLGFTASGYSTSTDGDVPGNHGEADGWIISEVVYAEPVVLSSFSASEINKTVLVKWASATEINSDHYEVQHSIDGNNFNVAGIVKATGKPNDYQFIDKAPQDGINYYRLKMIDKDGSFTYSNIVSVRLTIDNYQLSIYPNPARDNVTIKGSHITSVQVIDNLGRVVKVVSLKDATNPTLSVNGLPAGVYHLRVQKSDGSVSGETIVVSGWKDFY